MWAWIRRNIFHQKASKPVYRTSATASNNTPRVMHPLARFKEDINLLKSPFSFKFDSKHYFIVHFTAGRNERKPRDFFKRFLEMGLCTYFIDGSGNLWQQHHGDMCGYHIGKNKWLNKNIGKKCAGVEIACSGKLEKKGGKFFTWYGEEIHPSEVRTVKRTDGYHAQGHFRKFTPEQEEKLAELIAFHIARGIPISNVLGHDMVAFPRGRKNDPAGSLSMPLEKFVKEVALPLTHKY